jgi:MATE family, multidrug efflux pump
MIRAPNDRAASRRPSEPGGVREVFILAYPVVLTQLSTTTMGAVDSIMVGRLGATELAAVGFAGIWIWTLFSLLFGTASGVQTFVSQAHGAGRPGECGYWMWQASYAVVPTAVLLGFVYAAAIEPAWRLAVPSDALRTTALHYFWARLPGETLFAVSMLAISFFRGLGDTRTPLYITLAANVLNIVLDYGLIFGRLGMPQLGVTGAGVATSLAQVMAASALVWRLGRAAPRRHFKTAWHAPDLSAIRRFLRTGAPIGGQWFFDMLAFALFTTLVARMGDDEMAASQALIVLLSFTYMQAIGISAGASTLVGRYIGARSIAAARRAYRSAMILTGAVSSIVATLFVTLPTTLLRLFVDDTKVLAIGLPLIWLGAVFQFFDGAVIVSEGALRGAGDTRWPFVMQSLLNWVFFLPLAYLLAVTFRLGLMGAWIAELSYMVLLALLLIWRFETGAWEGTHI